jgi:hypothetical protein
MNIREIARQNTKNAAEVNFHFRYFISRITTMLDQYREETAGSEHIVEIRSRVPDLLASHGPHIVTFESNNSHVRLYSNQPVGWIYGEVTKAPPLSICKKSFAFRTTNSMRITIIGCYLREGYMSCSELADLIVQDLLIGEIDEKDLDLLGTYKSRKIGRNLILRVTENHVDATEAGEAFGPQ